MQQVTAHQKHKGPREEPDFTDLYKFFFNIITIYHPYIFEDAVSSNQRERTQRSIGKPFLSYMQTKRWTTTYGLKARLNRICTPLKLFNKHEHVHRTLWFT